MLRPGYGVWRAWPGSHPITVKSAEMLFDGTRYNRAIRLQNGRAELDLKPGVYYVKVPKYVHAKWKRTWGPRTKSYRVRAGATRRVSLNLESRRW